MCRSVMEGIKAEFNDIFDVYLSTAGCGPGQVVKIDMVAGCRSGQVKLLVNAGTRRS